MTQNVLLADRFDSLEVVLASLKLTGIDVTGIEFSPVDPVIEQHLGQHQ